MSNVDTPKKKTLDEAAEDVERARRKARRKVDAEEAGQPYELIVRNASDIVLKRPERIFGNRFERGSFNFIVGQGEVGKGMISMDIIAKMTTGEPFPGEGSTWRKPMKVIICAVEDSDNEIVGRLTASSAELKNIALITGPTVLRGGLEMPSAMRLDSDAGPLVKLARDKGFGAIFIETMVEHFGDREGKTRISTSNEAEVRGALAPFRAICREANIYGWALIHPRKSTSGDVSELISGSAAFYNVPRLTMYVFKDPLDEDKNPARLLCSGKANNLVRRPPTLRCHIESWKEDAIFGHTVWGIEGKSLEDDRDVEEIRAQQQEKQKNASRKDVAVIKAEEFLRKVLSVGKLTPDQIKEKGEAEGIAWRSIERAKKNLGLVSIRENIFHGGVIGWEFPKEEM